MLKSAGKSTGTSLTVVGKSGLTGSPAFNPRLPRSFDKQRKCDPSSEIPVPVASLRFEDRFPATGSREFLVRQSALLGTRFFGGFAFVANIPRRVLAGWDFSSFCEVECRPSSAILLLRLSPDLYASDESFTPRTNWLSGVQLLPDGGSIRERNRTGASREFVFTITAPLVAGN